MTVHTWKRPNYGNPEGSDEVASAIVHPSPRCFLCGEYLTPGGLAWSWHGMAGQHITAHARCVQQHAKGIVLDIMTCVRLADDE